MVKTYVLVLLSSLVFFCCTKDQEADKELPDPIQTMINTYDKANCTCMPIINQYNWKAQTLFVLSYRGPACNWVPSFYNKEGKVMNTIAPVNYTTFLAESQLVRKVWSCE